MRSQQGGLLLSSAAQQQVLLVVVLTHGLPREHLLYLVIQQFSAVLKLFSLSLSEFSLSLPFSLILSRVHLSLQPFRCTL